jgi:predicted Zn-dependent protease
MLFDLRSRGRRRTVQAVYLGLALILGGGLVLFGVGAGNGFGGILNAFNGNGSGSGQKQAVSSQEKAALRATTLRPNDPAGWSQMIQARYANAGQGSNYDTATGTYTSAGKAELTKVTQAWQRYIALTKKPDPTLAVLAARAYGQLGQYANEASAWEVQSASDPTQPKGFECLAASAYAAGQTRKADLAAAKALSLVPKAQQAPIKQQLQLAKTNKQVAQLC